LGGPAFRPGSLGRVAALSDELAGNRAEEDKDKRRQRGCDHQGSSSFHHGSSFAVSTGLRLQRTAMLGRLFWNMMGITWRSSNLVPILLHYHNGREVNDARTCCGR
jgi:hypothetical protein